MKAFETERLQVHRMNASDPEGLELIIFTAFSLDEMPSRPAVTATVRRHPYPDGHRKGLHYVWWVEVPPDLQRQGYAAEMLDGVEEHLGRPLIVSGATDAGGAFADYWNSDTPTSGVADDLPLYFWREAAKEVGGMAEEFMNMASRVSWAGTDWVLVGMPWRAHIGLKFLRRVEVADAISEALGEIAHRKEVSYMLSLAD